MGSIAGSLKASADSSQYVAQPARHGAHVCEEKGQRRPRGQRYAAPVRRAGWAAPEEKVLRRASAITSAIESFQILAAARVSAGSAWFYMESVMFWSACPRRSQVRPAWDSKTCVCR